jgi:branched-chain amino acid transport system substrate-binding protein
MRKKKFGTTAIAFLTGLAVLLAGCGGGGSTPTSQPEQKTATTAQPAQNTATEKKEPPKDFVIGVSGPLTGGSAAFGQAQIHSIELAVEEINNAGGINGAKIKIISEDDQANPTKGVTIAQKFVTKDNVDAVIGPVNTGVALAMGPVFEKAGIPTITALPTNDSITVDKNFIFQLCATSSMQAEYLAQYVKESNKKVGIIHDTTAWGEGNKKYALEALEAVGITPVGVESLTVGKNDYSPQMLNLKKAGAELLIAGILGPEGAVLSKNAKQINYDVPIVGPNAIAQKTLIELGKDDVEGLVFTSVFDGEKPEIQKFQEAFKTKHGYVPDLEWFSLAYDSVYILKKAFEEAGHDKEKVRDAIENLSGFTMISGKQGSSLSFAAGDHIALNPDSVVFLTVKDGQFVKFIK